MDSKSTNRVFLSLFFFFSGFCFATWASRIPTIKAHFSFNDAELGTLLFAMPIASLVGLPISGFLVSRFDSRVPLCLGFILQASSLILISYSFSVVMLVTSISLFALSMRILNVSINTQAITLQKLYNRKINGSFHGLWSTGGIVGIAFSTLLISFNVSINIHFLCVAALTYIATFASYRFLLKNDRSTSGNKLILGKPNPFIVYLGCIVFFAAVCEGGMFDWSGIYFREVVGEEIFTTGYLIFMTFMALSRFVSDRIIERIGMSAMYIVSSALIMVGMLLAVIFPYFWPALIGFSIVGFGTASIFPLTFTLAGTSPKYSSGMAISLITTYAIAGMLLGPPLIGYLSHAFGLRMAFIAFVVAGFMLMPVSQLFFKYQRRNSDQN